MGHLLDRLDKEELRELAIVLLVVNPVAFESKVLRMAQYRQRRASSD